MLRSPVLALMLATLAFSSAQAETRDSECAPTSIRVDDRKIEIWCAEPVVLNQRSRDRFRVVQRFAFPMVSQNFQPQFGSQVKLLDYYLEVAQNALLQSRRLHVWFETDYSLSQTYGCDPTDCREIVGLAVTNEPAVAPPESTTLGEQ